LPVERFEEIGAEPYGFEVEFCLPETVVAKQTMDFKVRDFLIMRQ
jgi:hypothetical protein